MGHKAAQYVIPFIIVTSTYFSKCHILNACNLQSSLVAGMAFTPIIYYVEKDQFCSLNCILLL